MAIFFCFYFMKRSWNMETGTVYDKYVIKINEIESTILIFFGTISKILFNYIGFHNQTMLYSVIILNLFK